MSIPNIPENVQQYIKILENKLTELEKEIERVKRLKVNRLYEVGPWRKYYLGLDPSLEGQVHCFLVHNSTEYFLVKSNKIADVLQATFNLMEAEDAELQNKVDGSGTEGNVTG